MISSAIKFLISLPYQLIHALRVLLYQFGVFQAKKLNAFVISVGNLSFGGSGKTPFTIALAKALSEKYKVAILTRGYKSKSTAIRTFLPSQIKKTNVDEIGDEAMEMLELLAGSNVKIIINKNRYLAAQTSPETEVFILDDGLQHLNLKRDLEIILQNHNESGFYREFPWAKSKADLLVHTKVDEDWLQAHKEALDGQKEAAMQYKISLRKDLDLSKPIALVTAIADPESFEKAIRAKLSELYQAGSLGERDYSQEQFYIREFPDHHQFTQVQVSELTCMGMNLVCTLKDYVKIPSSMQGDFIPVDLSVEVTPPDLFEQIAGTIDHGQQRMEQHTRKPTAKGAASSRRSS